MAPHTMHANSFLLRSSAKRLVGSHVHQSLGLMGSQRGKCHSVINLVMEGSLLHCCFVGDDNPNTAH